MVLLISMPISGLFASSDENAVVPDKLSIDEIARELSSPVTSLRYIGNEIKYRTFQGDLPDSDDMTGPGLQS